MFCNRIQKTNVAVLNEEEIGRLRGKNAEKRSTGKDKEGPGLRLRWGTLAHERMSKCGRPPAPQKDRIGQGECAWPSWTWKKEEKEREKAERERKKKTEAIACTQIEGTTQLIRHVNKIQQFEQRHLANGFIKWRTLQEKWNEQTEPRVGDEGMQEMQPEYLENQGKLLILFPPFCFFFLVGRLESFEFCKVGCGEDAVTSICIRHTANTDRFRNVRESVGFPKGVFFVSEMINMFANEFVWKHSAISYLTVKHSEEQTFGFVNVWQTDAGSCTVLQNWTEGKSYRSWCRSKLFNARTDMTGTWVRRGIMRSS